MNPSTTPQEGTMNKRFTVTVGGCESADKGLERLERRLPEGAEVFDAEKLPKLRYRFLVEVPEETDVDDLWVVLTSYGMDPSRDLGSSWQGTLVDGGAR